MLRYETGRFSRGLILLALLGACQRAEARAPHDVANRDSSFAIAAQLTDTVYLDDAILRRLVDVSLCALGASTGKAVIMVIKSLVDEPVTVRIRDGTFLRNGDGASQNMVVRRTEAEADQETAREIGEHCEEAAQELERRDEAPDWPPNVGRSLTLETDQTRVFLLSAYCVDFEKDNPGAASDFQVEAPTDADVTQLFAYIHRSSRDYGDLPIQLATWALTADASADEMTHKFPHFDETDRESACELLDAAGFRSSERRLCDQSQPDKRTRSMTGGARHRVTVPRTHPAERGA